MELNNKPRSELFSKYREAQLAQAEKKENMTRVRDSGNEKQGQIITVTRA